MITFAQHQFTASTLTFVIEGTVQVIDKIVADLKEEPFNSHYARLVINKRGEVNEEGNKGRGGDIYFWQITPPDFSTPVFGVAWRLLVVNFRNNADLALLFKIKYCDEKGDITSWHMSLFSSHTAIFDHALGIPNTNQHECFN